MRTTSTHIYPTKDNFRAATQFLVNSQHCSVPCWLVGLKIARRLQHVNGHKDEKTGLKYRITKTVFRALVRSAMAQHRANQDIYLRVQSGRI